MDILKTEPEVGVNGSKPSFVVGPRQIPVEGEAEALVNDDPTEYRLDRYSSWLGRYCDASAVDRRNEACKTVCSMASHLHTVSVRAVTSDYNHMRYYLVVIIIVKELSLRDNVKVRPIK